MDSLYSMPTPNRKENLSIEIFAHVLAWLSGNALVSINVVTCHARLILAWVLGDRLRAGKPSRYVISHLGQLSLPSLRGR